ARPRNRLPPPMTTPTCTPSVWISAMSFATCVVTAGSMPYCCSPMRASPESFSRTRPYRAVMSRRLYLLGGFSDLHPGEPADGNVLAEDADRILHELRDCDIGIAHGGLLEEAELLVVAVQLSLHDLVDHLRGLPLHLVAVDLLLALDDVGGHVLAAHVGRARGRDVHRDLLRQL